MKRRKRAGALVALAVLGSLFVPSSAKAATTYEIEVGQSFFEQGVPGFSARIYPGSIRVHKGDTIHFSGTVALFPEGQYPQDVIPEAAWRNGGRLSFLANDPDEGPRAVKVNLADPSTDCGTQANPCVWGSNTDTILPAGPAEDDPNPDFSMWVTIDGNAGDTLWGTSLPSSEINTNIKVEVVGPQEAASTQEELNARAAALKAKDYEDAFALHNRMNAKRTFHRNAAGQRVYDIWAGSTGGPIELIAFYPKKISVPKGARVMYHFQDEVEPHTATFGGRKARELGQNGFMPVCDPDGDEGTSPDLPATFSETEPPCADMTQFEVDVDQRIVEETGNGRVTGSSDLENSGVKAPIFPEQTSYDAQPWTVKMAEKSNDKGFKYICLVHGGFMSGRVVVK